MYSLILFKCHLLFSLQESVYRDEHINELFESSGYKRERIIELATITLALVPVIVIPSIFKSCVL